MTLVQSLGTAKPLGQVLLLVLLFGLKQLIADYVLQNCWMVRGKGATRGWLPPLLAHAGVHGLLTSLIALLFMSAWWWLGLVDTAVHASLDRLKVVATRRGRWGMDQPAFWWMFGLDQEAHALTHLAFVFLLLASA